MNNFLLTRKLLGTTLLRFRPSRTGPVIRFDRTFYLDHGRTETKGFHDPSRTQASLGESPQADPPGPSSRSIPLVLGLMASIFIATFSAQDNLRNVASSKLN